MGPITGATSVVMPHNANAMELLAGGYVDSSSACDSGIIGPATAPWMIRAVISMPMLGASPHAHDDSTNKMIDVMNRRTCPKRCVSQPVSGTEMALATANEVMTHVPWFGATPRSPEMAGIDTLAMDESSTFIKVASDSATVPIASLAPVSGCGGLGAAVAMLEALFRPWVRVAMRSVWRQLPAR